MSDHQLLLAILRQVIWLTLVASFSAGLALYLVLRDVERRIQQARAEKQARRLMQALGSATIVALRSSPHEAPAEDTHRVH